METINAPRRQSSRALPTSSLHEMHRLVEQHPRPVTALHVGEPHFRVPAPVIEAYCAALRDGRTSYTDAPGMVTLRAALADHLQDNGAPPVERVFVGPGSCQLIAAILQALAVPGGSVIVSRLHWPMHLQQILLAGLRPQFLDLPSPGGEDLEAALDEAADDTTVAVLLNSPSNPSGQVWSRPDLERLYAWTARRQVQIISDEAYEDFVYDGEPPRIAALDGEQSVHSRRVYSVHTFSKGYSMTGCRLGYATAPTDDAADLLTRVQQATLVAPATPVQYAGLAALRESDHLGIHHRYVRQTRDLVLGMLPAEVRPAVLPQGGWYLLLDVSGQVEDSYRLCRRLLDDADLAIAPGRGFFPPGDPRADRLVRVSLCADRVTTIAGIRRLLTALGVAP